MKELTIDPLYRLRLPIRTLVRTGTWFHRRFVASYAVQTEI